MKTRFLFFAILFFGKIVAQDASFLWANRAGSFGSDGVQDIVTDAAGNIYTCGEFEYTVDFDPGPGVYNLQFTGVWDGYVRKLDANGNFIWAIRFGDVQDQVPYSLDVDSSGNVYVTGYFEGTVDFDPGSGTHTLTSDGPDIFILKLDTNGDFVWVKKIGGLFDRGYKIAATNDDVYVTGYFQGTVDFDPGSGTANLISTVSNTFVLKLDTDGNYVWAKSISSESNNTGYEIDVDQSGNVYTVGSFAGTADFNPGAGTANLSTSSKAAFIQKLDSSGNYLWAKRIYGIGDVTGKAIKIDSSGNIVIGGSFSQTVDFDPGTATLNLTSAGSEDVFIEKLDTNGNLIWVRQMQGTAFDYLHDIDVDANGDIYATGLFNDTVDFDPGSGTYNLTPLGITDAFIQKLSNSGNLIWAKQIGGETDVVAMGVHVDYTGNVITVGNYWGDADFDPGEGVFNMAHVGSSWAGDMFIMKMSNSVLGISENDFLSDIRIFPNPAQTRLNIDLGTLHDAEVCITDVSGKIVYRKSTGGGLQTIDLQQESGLYFVKISSQGRSNTSKLIIR